MKTLYSSLYLFFSATALSFVINSISISLKAYIFYKLITFQAPSQHIKKSLYLLIVVLFSSIMCDSTWLFKLIQQTFMLDYYFYLLFLRIAWGFYTIQFTALMLFLESLIATSLSWYHKISTLIASAAFIVNITLGFFYFDSRPPIEKYILALNAKYVLFILIPSSLIVIIYKLRSSHIPKILTKQFKILISALIIPVWILELLQMNFFNVLSTLIDLSSVPAYWVKSETIAANISTLLLTCAILYCTRKVMSLRFLNIKNHVESKAHFSFMNGFKDILEQLGHATNPIEIKHITQSLFKEAFHIPLNKVILYIRQSATDCIEEKESYEVHTVHTLAENFITDFDEATHERIKKLKIIIYDELAFSNFYENNPIDQTILHFMETINTEVFIPIYEKSTLTGYIIIERFARPNNFYGTNERNEMLVFTNYVSVIINLLKTRNLPMLIQQQKTLKEELYYKHQEINQYKESIRSFIRKTKDTVIGIIFYKNRQFIFGNKAARELIPVNINNQEGHPITRALKSVARQVEEYHSPITNMITSTTGDKLILSGVPNLEKNNVIITIHYPEISDVIKKQLSDLNDPTTWDYLLYLETTKSGQLINKLIPGSGETLLNFKIKLLKIALHKKATLLEIPEEDLSSTVEIIHHISLRDTLYHLKIKSSSASSKTAIKLFGINPLFSNAPDQEKPLLEQLHDNGTLFIQNIDFLDLETQEYLAEFLKYGMYRMYKGEKKQISNARIICSTNQNLQTLVHAGTFSKNLFNELKQNCISMPSLMSLSEHELYTLADGFTQQILTNDTLKNILELTDREKKRLSNLRPVSLHELKNKVQKLLTNKSLENQVYEETQFDPAYELSNPELIEASRLGKHALRDPKIMAMLWNKFKSQAKIATFLGVNRSSVNRRCKDYNLTK